MTLSVLLSGQLLASVLVLASLYALVAIGLNLVYGTMRLLNVAHGELVMLGGYVAYWGFVRFGISPLLSAFIAMALAALAGALISTTQEISPFMGFPFTVSGFVIIILGGLGNLTGSIFGAVVLAAVEVYGVALMSPSFRSILVYGVFIAVLLLRPQGLLGRSIRAR